MDEIDYQICLSILDNLASMNLITACEKDRITALLKEEFTPVITLLTG